MNKLLPFAAFFVKSLLISVTALSILSGCENQSETQPSQQEIARLALNTTLDFARAVNAGNLVLFWNTTADDFKQKFTARQFNMAFDGFIKQKINLLAIQNMAPVFDPKPEFTDNKDLVVHGYFPTTPSRVIFDYSFKQDPVEWKIIGINIKIVPQG